MAKDVFDISHRLQSELPNKVAAILQEKNLDLRKQQANTLNAFMVKLLACIDACGENLLVSFSKLGAAITELKTTANELLPAQAPAANNNNAQPIPELTESLLAISLILNEQQQRLSPLLKPLPPAPALLTYSQQALYEASQRNELATVEALYKLMPASSSDAKPAFKLAIHHKGIDVARFWVGQVKDFEELSSYRDELYPNLLFKLCSEDVFQPVLEACANRFRALGLSEAFVLQLRAPYTFSEVVLAKLKLKGLGLFQISGEVRDLIITRALNPSQLALLRGQAGLVAYLQMLLSDNGFTQPKRFMTLMVNITHEATLEQLALTAKLALETEALDMPLPLHQFVKTNAGIFNPPASSDLSRLPVLARYQALTQYALLEYVFRRASTNYCVYYSQTSMSWGETRWDAAGVNNALLFLTQAKLCKDIPAFFQLLEQLLSKTHRTGDHRSFRGVLLPLLCRDTNFFVEGLKVSAESCKDNYPVNFEVDYVNLDPLINYCVRLLKIQLDPLAQKAFEPYVAEGNSVLEQLRAVVNLATRRYFQNNCLADTVSEPGFVKAKNLWSAFIACNTEKEAVEQLAGVLTKGQTSSYKENSHLYLIARAIIENDRLSAHFKISETTRALTDKNALVKAVAAEINATYGLTVAKPGFGASLHALLPAAVTGRGNPGTKANSEEELKSLQNDL